MNLFSSLFKLPDLEPGVRTRRTAIVRISYGRLGEVLEAKIKISGGDAAFDARAIEHVRKLPHPALHHPGKNKKRRMHQWYEIRYFED